MRFGSDILAEQQRVILEVDAQFTDQVVGEERLEQVVVESIALGALPLVDAVDVVVAAVAPEMLVSRLVLMLPLADH